MDDEQGEEEVTNKHFGMCVAATQSGKYCFGNIQSYDQKEYTVLLSDGVRRTYPENQLQTLKVTYEQYKDNNNQHQVTREKDCLVKLGFEQVVYKTTAESKGVLGVVVAYNSQGYSNDQQNNWLVAWKSGNHQISDCVTDEDIKEAIDNFKQLKHSNYKHKLSDNVAQEKAEAASNKNA